MKNNLSNISFAIFLIFFGLVALLVSFNYVTWENLLTLFFRFWPVLIIIGGLKIIVGIFPYGNYVNLAIDIAVNLLIIFSLLFFSKVEDVFNYDLGFNNSNTSVTKEITGLDVKEIEYKVSDVKEREYKLTIGASTYTVTDKDSSDYLTTSGTYNSSVFEPKVTSELVDGKLNIKFTQQNVRRMMIGMWSWNTDNDFNFNIGQKTVPTSFDINLGAGEGIYTLTQTPIKDIKANVGAGNLEIDTRLIPTGNIDISVGAGNVVITLPKETQYKLKYSVGAGNVRILDDSTIVKEFGGLVAKGDYGTGTLIITTSVGAGNVDIVLK